MFELKFLALFSNFVSSKISDGSIAKTLEAKKKNKKNIVKTHQFIASCFEFLYEVKDSRLTNPPKAINITPTQMKDIKGLM